MSLLTLLKPGSIIKQKWMPREMKRKIDTMNSIDFLVEYIGDRIWQSPNMPPAAKLKGIGSKVLVLRSGTGSGKSTLLPPFLHAAYFEKLHKNLIITQPTKATTTDIPYKIIQYNDLTMGETIGFQTSSVKWKPVRGILFSTVGILLQHLTNLTDEEFMRKYAFVIIDEVHRRSTDVDMALYNLKQLLLRNWDNPDCPFLILTSATFDPKIFMEYFRCPKEQFIDVAGATFPRYVHFPKFDLSDFLSYAVDLTEKIHVDNVDDIKDNKTFRDVLIFVSGGAQIREISDRIHKLNATVFSKGLEYAKKHSAEQWEKWGGGPQGVYYIAPIATMSANIQKGGKEYRDLFSNIDTVTVPIYELDKNGEVTKKVIKTVKASRRVMIGTNAIETGMTIDTLGYCIDTGFANDSSFNPNFGCTLLFSKNVTQANSEQRKGRVGRKAPGDFYPAYTEKALKAMPELPFPEIVKEDISNFLLDVIINETKTELCQIEFKDRTEESFQMNQFDQNWYELKSEKKFEASQLDFIQYPSSDSIGYSTELLHGLGFIDHEYYPTLFGYYASRFRKLRLQDIRMILAGYQYGANILDLITMVCCMNFGYQLGINKRKYKPRDPLKAGDKEAYLYYKMLFADEFIEFLFIWNDFQEVVSHVGNLMEKSTRVTKKTKISLSYIEKWCKENNFKYSAFLNIVEARDEVIRDMLGMGLNPYYNGLGLTRGTYNLVSILRRNLQEGVEEVRKLKQCIYEGYRFNVCEWNPKVKSYINVHYHYEVFIDSNMLKPLFVESKYNDQIKQMSPQTIIVRHVRLGPSFRKKGMFEFRADYASSMDGYVNIDKSFLVN